MLDTLENGLLKLERVLVTLLIAVTFLTVVLQVIVRFFKLSIGDSSDLSLVSIAVMTFLCVGLLTHKGGHISIEVTNLLKSKRSLFFARTFTNVGILLFVVVFGIQAFKMLLFSISSGEATMQMRIPMVLPFGALVFGLVSAAFHAFMNFKRDLATYQDADAEFEVLSDVELEDATAGTAEEAQS